MIDGIDMVYLVSEDQDGRDGEDERDGGHGEDGGNWRIM